MKICDYSSLIFTGNTSVLLILALTTDYWEYRTFNRTKILQMVEETERTSVLVPFDTDSYFQIKLLPNITGEYTLAQFSQLKNEAFYHAPLFLVRRFFKFPVNVTTNLITNTNDELQEYELDMFEQYGNLFRDCDSLEELKSVQYKTSFTDAVRIRIGLNQLRPDKCVYFHDSSKSSHIHHDAPQLNYLEATASACAMMCIALISVCLVTGAYGLFAEYNSFNAFHVASCTALIAGFFLTIGIALFHGKCHILRKMEFFPGHKIPYKNILHRYKVYSYGWSFVLAWICVFFCYIAAYVWLSKAQRCRKRIKSKSRKLTNAQAMPTLPSNIFINFLTYNKNGYNRHDIATV